MPIFFKAGTLCDRNTIANDTQTSGYTLTGSNSMGTITKGTRSSLPFTTAMRLRRIRAVRKSRNERGRKVKLLYIDQRLLKTTRETMSKFSLGYNLLHLLIDHYFLPPLYILEYVSRPPLPSLPLTKLRIHLGRVEELLQEAEKRIDDVLQYNSPLTALPEEITLPEPPQHKQPTVVGVPHTTNAAAFTIWREASRPTNISFPRPRLLLKSACKLLCPI